MLLFNIIYIMRISNRYPIVGRGFTASIYSIDLQIRDRPWKQREKILCGLMGQTFQGLPT